MQKLNNQNRILGRSLALELTPEDVLQVFGGTDEDGGGGGEGGCKNMTQTHIRNSGPDDSVCDDK